MELLFATGSNATVYTYICSTEEACIPMLWGAIEVCGAPVSVELQELVDLLRLAKVWLPFV